MELTNDIFALFERDSFQYRAGDEITKNEYTEMLEIWTAWCNDLAGKIIKFEPPIIKSWQNSGQLARSFWTRIKYTPFLNSGACVSLYANISGITMEVSYEIKNDKSDLSKEEYSKLIVENLDEWVETNNIDRDLFIISVNDGKNKCTLTDYYSNLEKRNWFKNTNLGVNINVGVEFSKEQVNELDTNSNRLISIIQSLSYLYEKVQKPHKVYDELKIAEEIIPDQYDGSYELVRETVKAFKAVPYDELNMDDLNALFFMSVGTFKRSMESKKSLVEASNLPTNEKQRIINLMDEIEYKAKDNLYSNHVDGNGYIGMFGVGFMTFNKADSDINTAKDFIKLCIEISDLDNDEEIFSCTEKVFSNNLKGLGAASASTFLHCLKPYTFPILNGKQGEGTTIYDSLGIKLQNPKELKFYIQNAKAIKQYRDKYFSFKNYRAMDIVKVLDTEIHSMKKEFADWLTIKLKGDQSNYKDSTVNTYVKSLEKTTEKIINPQIEGTDLFLISDYTEFCNVHRIIVESTNFDEINKKDSNCAYSAAMNLYEEFLKDYQDNNTSIVSEEARIWLYAPGANACMWDEFYNLGIMAIGWSKIGDLRKYKSKEEIKNDLTIAYGIESSYTNDGLALWQFANEIKIGDLIYAKLGANYIIGRGIVTSHYIFDNSKEEYKHIVKVNWDYIDKIQSDGKFALKTLTEVTMYKEFCKELERKVDSEDVIYEKKVEVRTIVPYTKTDFLNEAYISEDKYDKIVSRLGKKKNIILQGAPGVGKSFLAKKLAYSIIGHIDEEKVQMIQFHQSYSYEDFIMGYRPNDKGGFDVKNGVFYNFCKNAIENPAHDYYFIIDEINRGNLSKIFGELMLLIEADKRGRGFEMSTVYSDDKFYIPENLYIIGLMNTADRSLALLDYALRRRFSFIDIEPAFGENFTKYTEQFAGTKLEPLIKIIIDINDDIENDDSLGKGFKIGHSYFCNCETASTSELCEIIECEIIPLLEEYWFDNADKVKDWTKKLNEALQYE